MSAYNKLFTPVKIGSMELKNRLVMAPMTLDLANQDETPSQRQIGYYAERAKGGVGLIGLEVVSIDSDHRYQQKSLGLYNDEMIAGHKKLVDAVHAAGGKIQPQLVHPGPESLAPIFKNIQPIGPSVIRTPTTTMVCEEATLEQLEAAIELFGDAARRAREAGYDGIELHAAHSYLLLGSFLSPIRNHRQDEYGGRKLEGRMKLLLQAIENIRQKVGRDFPMTLRLSGYERDPAGRTVDETQRMIPILEQAGVDCFHISGGVTDASISQIITGSSFNNGLNVAAARAVKMVANVPVMVVGRNWDPLAIENIIDNEEADMVVLGRPLLADPEIPNKLRAGKQKDIRMCHSCQVCVDDMMANASGVKCAINARCCKEADYPLVKASVAKRVLIIGGGPGGMEAARVACARGHQVTLIEKDKQLGGAFRYASYVHPDNKVFLEYLIHQMQSLPVELILGKQATEKDINDLKPDAIVVATGANMAVPEMKGADLAHVIKGLAIRQLITDIIDSEDSINQKILAGTTAIVGCGLMGVELAIFLAKRGVNVRLVDSKTRIAEELGRGVKRRTEHFQALDSLGVPVNTGVTVEEISAEGLCFSRADGERHMLKANNVILIDQPTKNTSLSERIESLADEVYSIGDCTGFGLSHNAVEQANAIVYKI